MSYHEWLLLKTLAIFLMAGVCLLVGALVEVFKRRRRNAVAATGANSSDHRARQPAAA
jgi:hypothetical protein